jgi:hypothetical protein
MVVSNRQRFTSDRPCPVCGGHRGMRPGQGVRCWGFISDDDKWATCTRAEYSGSLLENSAGGYAHHMSGNCHCGTNHGGYVSSIPAPRYKSSSAGDNDDNGAYARKIWGQGIDIKGTLAETYLKGRGIRDGASPSLRYYPRLYHSPTEQELPAMLSAVKVGNRITAIQRTYLKRDGSGKADVEPNKMSLGSMTGGAVHFGEPDLVLGLAEGVETALSVVQQFDIPVWAILGCKNMPNVILPELPLASEVRLYVDGDDDGRDAAVDAGRRYTDEGRRVYVCPAPDNKDWNDVLMEGMISGRI